MCVLGLDVGIASVGWALIDDASVLALGVWMHDPPEDRTQSGSKLRSEARRMFRSQRKVIRRRRQRMAMVRQIFTEHGLLPSADRHALRAPGCDPWSLRARGLEQALDRAELAVALGHIARHRGFKSNAKGARKNDADTGKMLKASAQTQERLGRFETPARGLVEDDAFVLRETPRRDGTADVVRRLRNRDGDYSRSLLRDDLEAEARALFRAQRRLGMAQATPELEQRFMASAFHQRPLQDSEHMVGTCPFEPKEMRAARRGFSFERFRYLSRLTTLRLTGRAEPRLTAEEIGAAAADFGATAKISFSNLRRKLALAPGVSFEGVKAEDEGKRDVVARSGEAAAGTARLRKLIAGFHGEMMWRSLAENMPATLDRVAEILSFRSDLGSIAKGLEDTGLDPAVRVTLLEAAQDGDLDVFSGAGHISAKAARAILPHLRDGKTYDKACGEAGYDHTASRERHALDTGAEGIEALSRLIRQERISREIVGSPTARKALIEALKQVKAIVEMHGLPDRVHVELARDVGKSIEEREEIERGIEKRNRQKDRLRAQFQEMLGRPPRPGGPGAEELLRFELWEQQGSRCLYTDAYISPNQLDTQDNSVQVDHILPWSRFADDSFHNRVLCTAQANQNKKNRTPYEWFMQDMPEKWDAFVAGIRAVPDMKGMKRRNFLLQNADEVVQRFRERNLNDTRWSCRLLAEALRQVLPDVSEGRPIDANGKTALTRRVFARPGPLTDRLRRAWGLQFFKKDDKLRRVADDRHHALDALIVAATTESVLNCATQAVQEMERQGLPYDLSKVIEPPWKGFREDALAALAGVFVARAPRPRARGKAHDATIRQIRTRDGKDIVFERKRVGDLKLADLDRVKDGVRNAPLIENLRAWIEAGSPKDRPPLSPKGDPIAKVRLETRTKVGLRLHRGGTDAPAGAVDRGEMARVDVFAKRTPKGVLQYFLVPIYPHEIATLDRPPNRAVAAGKPESEWQVMDETYEFLWSLVPMSLVRAVDKKATVLFAKPGGDARWTQADGNLGYFRGLDRATGAISLSSIADQTWMKTGIGARTLASFQKMTVDRLGGVFEVRQEIRTWRGEACI